MLSIGGRPQVAPMGNLTKDCPCEEIYQGSSLRRNLFLRIYAIMKRKSLSLGRGGGTADGEGDMLQLPSHPLTREHTLWESLGLSPFEVCSLGRGSGVADGEGDMLQLPSHPLTRELSLRESLYNFIGCFDILF